MGYLFGIFVYLGTHHIASNWFEIFHTSPNHFLLSIRQSLSKLWCTAEGFLELTSGCNILPLSFLLLNFWKFANSCKITWNFHKRPKQSSLRKKPTWICPGYILVVSQTVQHFTSIAFRGYLFHILFIWELTISYQIDLKFCTHHRITACCL